MAEETNIALTITIGGEEKILKNLKEIKAARKDLQNAFLQGDTEAAKSLAKLEDGLEDIKDATKSVKGEGLEPLRNSFGLFYEGLTNFDFGKIGTAFKGLGAAMKAVPIFLLVEGITYLITNFKELSEGSGILAKVLKPVGEIITFIIDGIYALTDSIGLTNSELDKMGENVVKNADKAKEAISQQNAEYDRQIAVAKAAGKSTVEIEQAKQQAIIDTNVQVVKQIEAFVRAGGVLDEEKQKLLTASLEAIKNAKVQEYVIEANHKAEVKKLSDDAFNERMKQVEKEVEEQYKKKQDLNNLMLDVDRQYWAEQRKLANEYLDIKRILNAEEEVMNDDIAATALKRIDANLKAKEEAKKTELQIEKEKEQQKQEITTKSVQAAQALTNLYFDQQLKSAKGNAEKEREIKKKQFNINKAFGITNAVIDGVRSVQAALTQTPPLSYVLAALNAALAIANVAQIASAKFDDSGGGGSSSGASIPTGSVGGASAPTIASPNNTVTQIDDKGEIKKAKEEQPVVKAIVTEEDITDKQKRVNTIKEAAEL